MNKREYGSGSIYYSETHKRWVGQYKTGVTAEGKPKKKTIYGKTKREVKDKLHKLQAEIITGVYVEPSQLTIVHVAQSINDNKKALNIVSDTAYKRNNETIKIISNSGIGAVPLQRLTEAQINVFLASLTDYSNSVIRKVCMTMNTALKRAVQLDIINKNPMENVQRPRSKKVDKKVRALTIQEQQAVIAALNKDNKEPYRTMLLLELMTGMRAGEIAALPSSEIKNIQKGHIKINRSLTKDANDVYIVGDTAKTPNAIRTITLNSMTADMLKEYCDSFDGGDLLFTDKRGTLVTTNQLNSYFKRLIERYDIAPAAECNQHMLRHTYATRCIEAGMPAKVLQKVLGHADIKTTLNTYTDIFEEYEKKQLDMTEKYLLQNNIILKEG